MLFSLALLFLCGLGLGGIFRRLKLPPLLGMLLSGALLGPYALDLLHPSLLAIAPDLRKIALLIILTRVGLSLNGADLKKIGRPALLLCFLPACLEILGIVLLAPPLLGLSLIEAMILGTVLAAVSPAVIVPRMLRFIEEGRGTKHAIPKMMMAGASVDDVFVIVLFTSCIGLAKGEHLSLLRFAEIPLSILSGVFLGILLGIGLVFFFRMVRMRDSIKVIIFLSLSFLLASLEDAISPHIPFSGLIAVIAMGVLLQQKNPILATRLSSKYDKLWVAAELWLFVLVGALLDLQYAFHAGLVVLLILCGALLFRVIGVWLCLLRTPLSRKEKGFCMLAYCPKATVQAAIGAIPLSMGLACGQLVLTAAVLAIVVTAPLGALAIDLLAPKLLPVETE